MNLHEAAEIVRNKSNALSSSSNANRYIEACDLIERTMLDWLDQTPITKKWLEENEWERVADWWLRNGRIAIVREANGWMVHGFKLRTLGELRTLVRLIGGE